MDINQYKEPKDLMVRILKRVDLQKITEDDLINQFVFDFKIGTPEECRKIIANLREKEILTYDFETETYSLNPEVNSELNLWQQEGNLKANQMRKVLSKLWREPYITSEVLNNLKYDVFRYQLSDGMILSQADSKLISFIKPIEIDFSKSIQAIYQEQETDPKFSITIDIINHVICHNCADFHEKISSEPKFCLHLSLLLRYLFVKSPQIKSATLDLMRDIVNARSNWKIKS